MTEAPLILLWGSCAVRVTALSQALELFGFFFPVSWVLDIRKRLMSAVMNFLIAALIWSHERVYTPVYSAQMGHINELWVLINHVQTDRKRKPVCFILTSTIMDDMFTPVQFYLYCPLFPLVTVTDCNGCVKGFFPRGFRACLVVSAVMGGTWGHGHAALLAVVISTSSAAPVT